METCNTVPPFKNSFFSEFFKIVWGWCHSPLQSLILPGWLLSWWRQPAPLTFSGGKLPWWSTHLSSTGSLSHHWWEEHTSLAPATVILLPLFFLGHPTTYLLQQWGPWVLRVWRSWSIWSPQVRASYLYLKSVKEWELQYLLLSNSYVSEIFSIKQSGPFSVKNLSVSTEEERIIVMWVEPQEYMESYSYRVFWNSSDGPSSFLTGDTQYNISNLVPGRRYDLSVTTETSDGTQGAPRWTSHCTSMVITDLFISYRQIFYKK